MDQFRQDCDHLNSELTYELERQNNELEAKLAARRAKRLNDNHRKSEEEAAQRFLEQQVSKIWHENYVSIFEISLLQNIKIVCMCVCG